MCGFLFCYAVLVEVVGPDMNFGTRFCSFIFGAVDLTQSDALGQYKLHRSLRHSSKSRWSPLLATPGPQDSNVWCKPAWWE